MSQIDIQESIYKRNDELAAELNRDLTDHGVFTTPQLAHALFPSLDFAQHRLARLTALRVVDRFDLVVFAVRDGLPGTPVYRTFAERFR